MPSPTEMQFYDFINSLIMLDRDYYHFISMLLGFLVVYVVLAAVAAWRDRK